jgi:hypothetical protein
MTISVSLNNPNVINNIRKSKDIEVFKNHVTGREVHWERYVVEFGSGKGAFVLENIRLEYTLDIRTPHEHDKVRGIEWGFYLVFAQPNADILSRIEKDSSLLIDLFDVIEYVARTKRYFIEADWHKVPNQNLLRGQSTLIEGKLAISDPQSSPVLSIAEVTST